MSSQEEVAARHTVAQAKAAKVIEAIENGDEDWRDVAKEAMPAMSAFTDAVRDYALGELRRLDEERAERERLAARPWWQKVLHRG